MGGGGLGNTMRLGPGLKGTRQVTPGPPLCRELRGNPEGTPRELSGNSAGTQRELRELSENSAGTQQELRELCPRILGNSGGNSGAASHEPPL